MSLEALRSAEPALPHRLAFWTLFAILFVSTHHNQEQPWTYYKQS